MALKKIIPRSSGKREVIMVDYKSILTNSKPTKSLLKTKIGQGGRNNHGKITTRHQGSGHKRKYRIIDFKRNKDNIPGRVATVEYDPNRSAFISLINYVDGEKRYILAFDNLKIGQTIISGDKNIPIKPGNSMPIHLIPEGTFIHNIELRPSQGGQMMRSAGTAAQILGKDDTGKYVVVRLASGETRKILLASRATIGRVGNIDHNLVVIGKAGRNRWRGIRPTVRGSAMNPNDHPHGGGEGRTPIGKDAPRTPWGKRHLGVRTRSKKKKSNALIVKSRHVRK